MVVNASMVLLTDPLVMPSYMVVPSVWVEVRLTKPQLPCFTSKSVESSIIDLVDVLIAACCL